MKSKWNRFGALDLLTTAMSARRPMRWAAVLLVVLALPGGVAAQSAKDVYQNGLDALQQGRPEQAAGLFQQAINLEGEERKRIGFLSSDPYLPYFYLGQALYAVDDCDGALAAWEQSLEEGVVQELPQNLELHRGKAACTNRREVAAAAAEAEESLTAVGNRLTEVREGVGNPELAEFLDGFELEQRLSQVEEDLAQAREALAEAVERESVQDVREAARAGETAVQALEAVNQEAEGRLEQRRTEIGERIDQLVRAGRSTLQATAYLEPFPPQVARNRQVLQSLVSSAASGSGNLALGDMVKLAGQLQTIRRRLEISAARPPEVLSQAAEAYVLGDYESVLETLAEAELEGRAAAHAHLLRAAAMFSLAQGAEEPDELLLQAEDQIRLCAEADEGLVPTDEAFSPRFVEFFAEVLRVEEELPEDGEGEAGAEPAG